MQETQVRSLGSGRSPGEGNGNPLHYRHAGPKLPNQGWTCTPSFGSTILTTGPPGKPRDKGHIDLFFLTSYCVCFFSKVAKILSTLLICDVVRTSIAWLWFQGQEHDICYKYLFTLINTFETLPRDTSQKVSKQIFCTEENSTQQTTLRYYVYANNYELVNYDIQTTYNLIFKKLS